MKQVVAIAVVMVVIAAITAVGTIIAIEKLLPEGDGDRVKILEVRLENLETRLQRVEKNLDALLVRFRVEPEPKPTYRQIEGAP